MHAVTPLHPRDEDRTDTPSQRLTDVHGAARMYGQIAARTFLRWADAGIVPAGLKLGGRRLWSISALEEHIRDGAKPVRRKGGR